MSTTRAIANLDLSIGLVNIPIKMIGVSDSHDRKASMYHAHDDGSYGKVKMPKMCEGCGEIVAPGDISRGFENDGDIVMLNASEMETVAVNSGTSVEVGEFVKSCEVDPMLFAGENVYRLIPDPKRGKKAVDIYRTIMHILVEHKIAGVARYTRWGRNRLALLDVEPTDSGGVLVLRNMLWADELRPAQFPVLDSTDDSSIDQRLLPVATTMIESMTGQWNPSEYSDAYAAALDEAIEAKAVGAEVAAVITGEAGGGADEIADILAKLEQSIKRKEQAAPAKKSRSRRAVA